MPVQCPAYSWSHQVKSSATGCFVAYPDCLNFGECMHLLTALLAGKELKVAAKTKNVGVITWGIKESIT